MSEDLTTADTVEDTEEEETEEETIPDVKRHPINLVGTSKRIDRDGRITIHSMDDLQQEYPQAHQRILESHIYAMMEPGSVVYGPGVTLMLTAYPDDFSKPKYFGYVYPSESIGEADGGIVGDAGEEGYKRLGLLKISTEVMLGEPVYLGARGTVIQHFGSAPAHARAIVDAGTLRVTDADSCLFMKRDNEAGQNILTINSTPEILAGNMPEEAKLALRGGVAHSGRWLTSLGHLMSPDYVMCTLQNYVQFGIKVSLNDIVEVIRAIKRSLMLGDDEVIPTITIDTDIIPWNYVFKNTPLLRGWTY